jgi:hypothetical protein
MKPSAKALPILDQIRDLLDNEEFGLDNPAAEKKIGGLIQILKMHTSGFLPNDLQQIYLNEQIHKLDEYKRDLYRAERPRFWQSHGRCHEEMIAKCIIARGLIERHARDYEK